MKDRVVFESDALGKKQSRAHAVLVIREQAVIVSERWGKWGKWGKWGDIRDATLLLEVVAKDDRIMGRVTPVSLISRRSSFGNGFRWSRGADEYGAANDSRAVGNNTI